MSDEIVGRKRTADGTLFEIRAIGENADELTMYVQWLLRAADIAVRQMRATRAELGARMARLQVSSLRCQGGEHCDAARAKCEHVRATYERDPREPTGRQWRGVCPDCGASFAPPVAS